MFLGIPDFIWNRIFDVLQVFFAAGLVAWFSSVILRKRDELTKVKGFQLEKRLKAYERVNELLSTTYSRQYEREPEKLEVFFDKLGLEPPHESLQCPDIFRSYEAYQSFGEVLRRTTSETRLYLDLRVKNCIIVWQEYFHLVDIYLDLIDKMPFKSEYRLSSAQIANKQEKLLRLLGVLLNGDLTALHGKTEDTITDQLYRLRLEDGWWLRWKHKNITLRLQTTMEYITLWMENSRFSLVKELGEILSISSLPRMLRSKRLYNETNQIMLLVRQIAIEEHLDGKLISELEWLEVEKIFSKLWTGGLRK